MLRLLCSSVLPPAGSTGTKAEPAHASEHPAFDWLVFVFEGLLDHALVATAHAALAPPLPLEAVGSTADSGAASATAAAGGAGGSATMAQDLSPDHVVFLSVLDAVLASAGAQHPLSPGDLHFLVGQLRHLSTPENAAGAAGDSAAPVAPLPRAAPAPSPATVLAASHTATLMRVLAEVFAAAEHARHTPPPVLLTWLAREVAWLGPHATASARGADTPTTPATAANPPVPPGYASSLLQLLAAASYGSVECAGAVLAQAGALESVLSHCKMSDHQPMQREWALMVVRNTCEVSADARQRISQLKATGVEQTPELKSMGLRTELDPETGQVRLTRQAPRPATASHGGTTTPARGRSMRDAAAEAAAELGLSPPGPAPLGE